MIREHVTPILRLMQRACQDVEKAVIARSNEDGDGAACGCFALMTVTRGI